MNTQDYLNDADYERITKETSDIRKILNEFYPNLSVLRQSLRAWEDGILTHEEMELLRLYVVIFGLL